MRQRCGLSGGDCSQIDKRGKPRLKRETPAHGVMLRAAISMRLCDVHHIVHSRSPRFVYLVTKTRYTATGGCCWRCQSEAREHWQGRRTTRKKPPSDKGLRQTPVEAVGQATRRIFWRRELVPAVGTSAMQRGRRGRSFRSGRMLDSAAWRAGSGHALPASDRDRKSVV